MANVTKKFAVIGYNISYSKSPKIHNAWFKQYGIDAEYEIMDVNPDELSTIKHLGLTGANVTIPYKKSILQHIDSTEGWGAVNTIKFSGSKAIATNTDALAIDQVLCGRDPSSKVLIIGNGGAALAAYWALTNQNMTNIHVLRRNYQRQEFLGKQVQFIDWSSIYNKATMFDIVINATPGNSCIPDWVFENMSENTFIVDFAYAEHEPPLTSYARKRGLQLVDGRELLISQAQHAFKYWFDIFPSVDADFYKCIFPEMKGVS